MPPSGKTTNHKFLLKRKMPPPHKFLQAESSLKLKKVKMFQYCTLESTTL